jgi:hypothetical protein
MSFHDDDDFSSSASSGNVDESLIPFDQRLDARKRTAAQAPRHGKKRVAAASRTDDVVSKQARISERSKNALTIAQNEKKRRQAGDKLAPVEMSAKVRVRRMGATVAGSHAKTEFRDPRFDPRCGTLARDVSRGSYYFVAELEQQEIASLRATLERAAQQDDDDPNFVDDAQVAEMQSQLDLLTRRRRERELQLRKSDQRNALLKQEADSVANGKRPFYHSRTAVRTAVLQAEFKDLKATNAVKRTILNRAKRSTAHARKSMPRRRLES